MPLTTFRRGDRVRCLVSTVDLLRGWELLGTLGTVVDVATVEPGTADAYEAVWVRWDHASPTWPRGHSIRHAAEDLELVTVR